MVKNTKRATADFINFACCLPVDMVVAFLISHGFERSGWSQAMTNAKTLAEKIGAKEAHAQLEAIRTAAITKRDAERAVALAAARTAWVAGDPRAFDAITWK